MEATKNLLGIITKRRRILGEDVPYAVREPAAPYGRDIGSKNGSLRLNKAYFWNVYPDIVIR